MITVQILDPSFLTIRTNKNTIDHGSVYDKTRTSIDLSREGVHVVPLPQPDKRLMVMPLKKKEEVRNPISSF